MNAVLVDSNVPVIDGEVGIGFEEVETLEAALPPAFRREPIPWDAAFLAGKSFAAYRTTFPAVELIFPS